MTTSIMVHCSREQDIRFRLTDIMEVKHFDGEIHKFRSLYIGEDSTIMLSQEQAEQLCEVIEKTLYDEPTYKELNTICMNQQIRIEELEEKLREKEDSSFQNEHMAFQDVI